MKPSSAERRIREVKAEIRKLKRALIFANAMASSIIVKEYSV